MGDLSLIWGADLAVSATGDIATVSGTISTQQRIIRRLLTNPGDYIWQLGYGAGLARFVGQPANELYIRAIIRSQIFKETLVARSPEPVIDVQISPAGSTGTIYVRIQYGDALSGGTQTLSFSVGS
jgi:hypothetical protein